MSNQETEVSNGLQATTTVLIVTVFTAIAALFGGLAQLLDALNDTPDQAYLPILGIVTVLIFSILLGWFYTEHRRLTKKIASLKNEAAEPKCIVGGNCTIEQSVKLWPVGECSGLEDRLQLFIEGLRLGTIVEKRTDEYVARARTLRNAEKESWHVLYATQGAIEQYDTPFFREWIRSENREGKDERKRIVVIRNEIGNIPDKYKKKLRQLVADLAKTSNLRVITDKALSQAGYSFLLRDYGVFKDKETNQFEALMSFGLCDFNNIFANSASREFDTTDQEIAKSLISDFEEVWDAIDLKHDWEEARLLLEPIGQTSGEKTEHLGELLNSAYEWKSGDISSISRSSLRELFDNKIPAIRIQDFATADECKLLLSELSKLNMQKYKGVYPPIDRAGVTQFEAKDQGTDSYFQDAKVARENLERIFERTFDPLDRIMKRLSTIYNTDVNFAEEDGKVYFAGLVRTMKEGTLLHVDFAHNDAPSWCIANIDAQITWNLFLDAGKSGGECEIFNQPWQSCHEAKHMNESYGYEDVVVSGAQKVIVTPKVGDVVLFNCRNFHRVRETDGPRTTIGSFIGRMDNQLILWS